MDLDATIEKYESKLAYYKLSSDPNPSTAEKIIMADVRQLIEWLKDYKRLLEAEKNWRKSLEDEIAKKDKAIRSMKAQLDIKTESKSNAPELKPCPFCGTEVKLLKKPLYGYHGRFDFSVKCPHCGCTVDYIDSDTIYRSEEEAIANVVKSWNGRYVNWFERAKKSHKNLCDSCTTQGCIFQSGIVRNHCDFYKAESGE